MNIAAFFGLAVRLVFKRLATGTAPLAIDAYYKTVCDLQEAAMALSIQSLTLTNTGPRLRHQRSGDVAMGCRPAFTS